MNYPNATTRVYCNDRVRVRGKSAHCEGLARAAHDRYIRQLVGDVLAVSVCTHIMYIYFLLMKSLMIHLDVRTIEAHGRMLAFFTQDLALIIEYYILDINSNIAGQGTQKR
jgi:hypothetical protein